MSILVEQYHFIAKNTSPEMITHSYILHKINGNFGIAFNEDRVIEALDYTNELCIGDKIIAINGFPCHEIPDLLSLASCKGSIVLSVYRQKI